MGRLSVLIWNICSLNFLILSVVGSDTKNPFTYEFNQLWDGTQDPTTKKVKITFSEATVGSEKGVTIDMDAPYYDDPKPNGPPGAFYQLWDYEVVEAFFLSPKTSDPTSEDAYLELEFGPHSHHLSLLLYGRRNAIKHSMPLKYEAKIDTVNKTWHGSAFIPMTFFPPKVTKMNAYSISGVEPDRVYRSLFAGHGPEPDFHRLEDFGDINFTLLRPDNFECDFSNLWKEAIEEKKLRDIKS